MSSICLCRRPGAGVPSAGERCGWAGRPGRAGENPTHDYGDKSCWRLFNCTTLALAGRVAENPGQIVVLYAGRVVEKGLADHVLSPSYHPYTRLLIASVPELRVGWLENTMRTREALVGIDRGVTIARSGCPFFDRCPVAAFPEYATRSFRRKKRSSLVISSLATTIRYLKCSENDMSTMVHFAYAIPRRLSQTSAVREEIPLVAEAVAHELAYLGAPDSDIATKDALSKLLDDMW